MTPSDASAATRATLAEEIVATVREPLLVLDADLRVVTANPAFYRTFGTDSEDTLGARIFELGDGSWDIPELRRLLTEMGPTRASIVDYEVRHDFRDLGPRVMELNARRIPAREEQGERVLLAIENVTERERDRKELQRYAEALRRHTRELKRSNEELEQFAYVASHDLQEPLRMVTAYLELLERRYGEGLDEPAREFIEYAVDGARRMKRMVNDLLAYSRVGSRGGDRVPTEGDAALDAALSNLSRRIEEGDARITRDPLPRVLADEPQLARLLQNLLENAIRYRPPGEAPRIHVGAEREGEMWRLYVRDHGVGIPAEHRERIFQVFQRLQPGPTGREGTGIGLAIARKIVARHGGRIWVESEPGEGSTFYFTLPPAGEEAP